MGPGAFVSVLLPLFAQTPTELWLDNIKLESHEYSKARRGEKMFQGDSEDKDMRATNKIKKYSKLILDPTYATLNKEAEKDLITYMPDVYSRIIQDTDQKSRNYLNLRGTLAKPFEKVGSHNASDRKESKQLDWSVLRTIPNFD